jgi:chromosome segregation ATPase
MKDQASTPPDMTKEQAAELKQLRRAITKVEGDINREERSLRAKINKIDRAIETNRVVILRRAHQEIKAQAAAWLREQKPLRTQLARLTEGRAPAFKTRDAIAKRIAILEGRLAS